jgi:hypothetical protein
MGAPRIRFPDSIIAREVNGETLVLDSRVDLIHRLNATASYIWQRSQDGIEPEEIASALAQEFEVDARTAARDVAETLTRLRELDLVATGQTPLPGGHCTRG